MNINVSLGSKTWNLSFNKPTIKRVEPVTKVENTTHKVKITHCIKCNCILFPDEIMCPDCLTPARKEWTA